MNKSNLSFWIGIVTLVLALGLVGGYQFYQKKHQPADVVHGYVGGEKINFLQDPEVVRLLASRYQINLDIRKAGSIDMIQADLTGQDFLWPSSETPVQLYTEKYGAPLQEEMIFTTPIVLYSYREVGDALVQAGMGRQEQDVYYVDIAKLIQAILKDKTWADIGLPSLYGDVMIDTTDPSKSNSGNMFAGLVATILHKEKMVHEKDVQDIAPDLQAIFAKLGYMSTSSADLFSLYLRNGMGDKTITAGYENQLLEFTKMNAQTWQAVQGEFIVLYPEPTIWSSHVMIALNDQGTRLITALKDPDIQRLAWEQHGFRTSLTGAQEAAATFPLAGIPAKIEKVVSMPDVKAMSQIIQLFE